MKKNKLYTAIQLITVMAAGLVFAGACRKKEYEHIKRPYNEILRFTIPGYGDLDSVQAVLRNDSIIVYWNANAERPAKIKPVIEVSGTATITPASGQEVNFTDTTTYTVTAEDGTVKKYQLKPVFNEAVPSLFSIPVRYRWGQNTPIEIIGEYFMAGGDASAIKVYAQRLSDGFEFDLPVDAGKTTKTKIVANLPLMTAELDTGMHRLYVKVGDFASNFMDINFARPSVYNDPRLIYSATVEDPGKPLKVGDSLTLVWDVRGLSPEMYEKFYPKSNLTSMMLFMQNFLGQGEAIEVSSDAYRVTGNKIRIHLGNSFENYVGYYLHTLAVQRAQTPGESGTYYEYPVLGATNTRVHDATGTIPGDIGETGGTATLQLEQSGQEIRGGQDLKINYTFSNSELMNNYQENIDNIELVFRQARTSGQAYWRTAQIYTIANQPGSATFKLTNSSTFQSTALMAVIVRFKSNSSPAKYLYSTLILPDMNTLYIRN